MLKININLGKKELLIIAIALCVVAISISVFQCSSFRSDFEITDELLRKIIPNTHETGDPISSTYTGTG